jgi:polysaccharide biosynthesis/export protein
MAMAGLLFALLGLAGCASTRNDGSNREDRSVDGETDGVTITSVRTIYLSVGDEIRISVFGRPELTRQAVIPSDGKLFFPFLGDVDVAGQNVADLRDTISIGLAAQTSRLLSAGDTISVQIFRRPELSSEAIIAQDGMFPVPLIGDVQVIGLTPSEVSAIITDRLRRYVHEPQVMTRVVRYGIALPVSSPQVVVDLVRLVGERFFVLGEVRVPGVYPLVGQVSLLEAIAAAGGPSREAKTGSLLLVRAGGSGQPSETVKIDLDKVMRDGTGAGIVMNRGDVVYVPERTISQVARFTRNISDILRPIIDIETGIWLGQNIAEGPVQGNRDATTRILIDR